MSQKEYDKVEKLLKERGNKYGEPEKFFSQLAKAKLAIGNTKTNPQKEVGYMLLFKVIRYLNNPQHTDSLDDIEGYARIGKKLAELNKEKQSE